MPTASHSVGSRAAVVSPTRRRAVPRAAETAADVPEDGSFEHLQAELSRIDVGIRRAVRRWQAAGQDAGDEFRGLYVSDHEADALLSRPFGTSWGDLSPLGAEEESAFAELTSQAAGVAQAIAARAAAAGEPVRLEWLSTAFDLTPFDTDCLLVCLAPSLDLRYGRLYGYLQDDVTRKRPSVSLVLELLCPPAADRLRALRHLEENAPLIRHGLLQRVEPAGSERPPVLSQILVPDESVVAFVLGWYRPHEALPGDTVLSSPPPEEAVRLLAPDRLTELEQMAHGSSVLLFHGPDRVAQVAAARFIAATASRPLLEVDLERAVQGESAATRAVRFALRDARMTNAIPLLVGWDVCLHHGEPDRAALAELFAGDGLVIVAGSAEWQPRAVAQRRRVVELAFPLPDRERRIALWHHYVGDDADGTGHDLASLAAHFALTTAQVRDAAATARDIADRRGAPVRPADLFAAARLHSSTLLHGLARKIRPRYAEDDIVLPPDQQRLLQEIAATVRNRTQVLDDWGVGRKLASSPGIAILFAGPPGTGKTMAAEVIAGKLGLDLYKIDLATVVSKYIGETEKNLERIFNAAEASNAILLFDEADALFGKRSEVRDSHDRYANIEVSYLLQRMEAYDGVTILATNLRANLDEAFTRRLQFAVDFPFPEAPDRLRIWQTLFPPDVPHGAELDFEMMARRYKLAGGNIRNIIVAAAHLAAADSGTVEMDHLRHATRRELQKIGRLIGDEE